MKLSKVLQGLLVISALAGACNQFDKKDGKVVLDKGILEKAPFAPLTDSVGDYPKDPGIYFRRGELLTQNNQHELAYLDYKKSWDLKTDENTAIAFISNMFMLGKTEEGLGLLKVCVRKFPANPVFTRRLSETYVQTGRSKEALEQYDKLLQENSEDFESWYEKGMLLAETGDTANAIQALERSFVLQPIQLSGLALANLYAETKNPNTLLVCDAMLKRDTAQETIDPVFIKGIYFNNIHEPNKAIEQFDECIKRDWKFTEAYIEKGITQFQQKNMDAALKTFELAATVSNTYPDAYYWQGRCYEAIGKKEDALNNYVRALALDKSFVQARQGIERLRSGTK